MLIVCLCPGSHQFGPASDHSMCESFLGKQRARQPLDINALQCECSASFGLDDSSGFGAIQGSFPQHK